MVDLLISSHYNAGLSIAIDAAAVVDLLISSHYNMPIHYHPRPLAVVDLLISSHYNLTHQIAVAFWPWLTS